MVLSHAPATRAGSDRTGRPLPFAGLWKPLQKSGSAAFAFFPGARPGAGTFRHGRA